MSKNGVVTRKTV